MSKRDRRKKERSTFEEPIFDDINETSKKCQLDTKNQTLIQCVLSKHLILICLLSAHDQHIDHFGTYKCVLGVLL